MKAGQKTPIVQTFPRVLQSHEWVGSPCRSRVYKTILLSILGARVKADATPVAPVALGGIFPPGAMDRALDIV
jgi:hypothetical protein